MKKVLKTEEERIAYNCRKATLLIEKRQEIELTAQEKLELTMHLAGCYICRVYEQQSMLINDMVRHIFSGQNEEVRLDDDFKDQLKKKIISKLDKN